MADFYPVLARAFHNYQSMHPRPGEIYTIMQEVS